MDVLSQRAAALEVWARGLVERERRLAENEERLNARAAALQAAVGVEPLWSLRAEPVARQIRALILETGDDITTVAQGIGVEAEWAAAVLVGEVAEVDLRHIQAVCEGLHCSPHDLRRLEGGRAIAQAYGPELWPRHMEPLEPGVSMAPSGRRGHGQAISTARQQTATAESRARDAGDSRMIVSPDVHGLLESHGGIASRQETAWSSARV